jgi:hypothetical protein
MDEANADAAMRGYSAFGPLRCAVHAPHKPGVAVPGHPRDACVTPLRDTLRAAIASSSGVQRGHLSALVVARAPRGPVKDRTRVSRGGGGIIEVRWQIAKWM